MLTHEINPLAGGHLLVGLRQTCQTRHLQCYISCTTTLGPGVRMITAFTGWPTPRKICQESPEVCQFSSTETISQHCCNVSASNWIQRSFKGLGTFAFTNYVKITALVKNTRTFSSYFVIFLCKFEVVTGYILLLTVSCKIRQGTTIFAYQTGCQRRQCRFLIAPLIQLPRKCYYLQPKNAVF